MIRPHEERQGGQRERERGREMKGKRTGELGEGGQRGRQNQKERNGMGNQTEE